MLKSSQVILSSCSPRWTVLLALLALLLAACQTPPPLTTIDSTAEEPPPTAWHQVFFSDPTGPNAESLRGGPDKALADAIRQARLSVDMAVYNLDLWSIRDALLDAHYRGVSVRMVTDSDNLEEREIQDLKNAGIPLLSDRREGLMHNKFVVIDGQDVWTGSMNLTINSAYRNDDNLIHIYSSELAQDYTAEFDEMFKNDRFGPGSPANTPLPTLEVDGSQLEVYFSPDDHVERHVIQLIQSAKQSVKFMAYSFTSDKIAEAMLERARASVQVAGVFEEQQTRSNLGTEFAKLHIAGLDVRLDGNPNNMHHKVIIIDDKIVLTGSYNFTNNAETLNDENLLVIHDQDVAALFLIEFERVFNQGQP
jgi:phosphatidylserine/phosphatidylglycerophosphate/cardiolipin synthase-like enzyme